MRFAGITHGRMESEIRISSARIVCTVHPATAALEEHAHDCACFTLVLAGGFSEDAGGVVLRCRPGSLLFRPAFEPHRNRYGTTGCRSLLIELAPDHTAPTNPRLPHALRMVTTSSAVRLAREIGDLVDRSPLAGAEVDNHVLELAATAFEEARWSSRSQGVRSSRWLRRIYDRIMDEPHDVPSVAELADLEGVHVDHLIRTFRAVYGETPGVLARRLRARNTAKAIRAGTCSLAGVAVTSGFVDQSHMTRELRRFLGATPGSIRESLGNAE